MNKTLIGFAIAIALGISASATYKWKYDDWVAIPEARKALQAQLRDPDSAQFRNERISKTGALRGEVNAKNGMGGYVGFKKFVSHGAGSYVEDIGALGEESHQDFMLRMSKETGVMQRHIKYIKEFPGLPTPSKDEIAEQARRDLFNEKWAEACDGPAQEV